MSFRTRPGRSSASRSCAALTVAGAASLGSVAGSGGCAPSQRDSYYKSKAIVVQPSKGDGTAMREPSRRTIASAPTRR